MGLKDWILRKIVQKEGNKMLGGIMEKLSGYKTYITALLGIIVVIIGHFFGPINAGPVQIPLIESGDMWKGIWDALMIIFLRKGISVSKA